MSRRIVASLHGANGVVIQIKDVMIVGGDVASAFIDLTDIVGNEWAGSIQNGCRIVIGIPDDNTI